MNRVNIVTGGRLGPWALDEARPEDVWIGADRGAVFLVEHGIRPAISVGDFDSVSEAERDAVRRASARFVPCDPVDKDDTDTELAFRLALELEPAEIRIAGALGTRFDHSLANVHLLVKALEQDMPCSLVDEFNLIRLTDSRLTVDDPGSLYPYVSLLPLTREVTGVTLRGFQYPLTNHTITMGRTLTMSNALAAATGTVEIASGLLLVIQSRD